VPATLELHVLDVLVGDAVDPEAHLHLGETQNNLTTRNEKSSFLILLVHRLRFHNR
jgi:hypothetical protein